MTEHVRKLLGGYATGTLSDAEKQALFHAALSDDELFIALADEQALKDLLDDSGVRAQVLRATEEPKFTVSGAFREWFERPKAKALAATGAVLLAIIGFNSWRQTSIPTRVARVHEPIDIRPVPPVTTPESPIPVPPPAAARQARQTVPAPLKKDSSAAKQQSAPPETKEAEASQAAPQMAYAPPPPQPPAPAEGAVGGVVGGVPAMTRSVQTFRATDHARVLRPAGPVRYELYRRDADGEFRPVPPNFEFVPGDLVRVRVISNQPGAVAVSPAQQPTSVVSVNPEEPAFLPAAGGITIQPETTRLVLAFSPSHGVELTKRMATAQARRSTDESRTAASISIEIPIRQRRP